MPKPASPQQASPNPDALSLRYVGDGAALPDVPARDLTVAEVAALAIGGVAFAADLIRSGLYALGVTAGTNEPLALNQE
ncbi:MAG: hypothetical protein IPO81_09600 [Kouleothrix sp.]|nr:hypothetical protein [Kouleothrix sp.]